MLKKRRVHHFSRTPFAHLYGLLSKAKISAHRLYLSDAPLVLSREGVALILRLSLTANGIHQLLLGLKHIVHHLGDNFTCYFFLFRRRIKKGKEQLEKHFFCACSSLYFFSFIFGPLPLPHSLQLNLRTHVPNVKKKA